MNEATGSLNNEEKFYNFEMLSRSCETWEPKIEITPFDDLEGVFMWRAETEPVANYGHWAELCGFMRGEYEERKKSILESITTEGQDKTHDVIGWQVRPFMACDFMTNAYTPDAVNLRIQAILIPKKP